GHAGIDTVGGKLSWIETSDGRLTSLDLMDMQIQAKTLVITGCQTARRMIQPGDEWLGLMRSFYLSGASTIVSALWDIRDEAARLFAREFYKSFDGTNAPVAVEHATAAVRARRIHIPCRAEWNVRFGNHAEEPPLYGARSLEQRTANVARCSVDGRKPNAMRCLRLLGAVCILSFVLTISRAESGGQEYIVT